MSNKKALILSILGAISVLIVLAVCLGYSRTRTAEVTLVSPTPAVGPSSDIITAIENIERNKQVNDQIKQQLVEQGYPEEAVVDLLAQGA